MKVVSSTFYVAGETESMAGNRAEKNVQSLRDTQNAGHVQSKNSVTMLNAAKSRSDRSQSAGDSSGGGDLNEYLEKRKGSTFDNCGQTHSRQREEEASGEMDV